MAEKITHECKESFSVSNSKDGKNDEEEFDTSNTFLHKAKYHTASVDKGKCTPSKKQTDDYVSEYGDSFREKEVHFSRESTPERYKPGLFTRSPKILRTGLKSAVDRHAVYVTDAYSDTLSTSWAFTTRASIAPLKFDHMAFLKMTYVAYKEANDGKDGIPLSLLPEVLESARFMIPPSQDLVPLLRRIDPEYKSGDLVRWSLLQQFALQIEHKEAKYPCVFNTRCSIARDRSTSPSSRKHVQRNPSRRTHPEDDFPQVEPHAYDMMKEIDDHRRRSVKEGNYLAADAAAQRLLELKIFEDSKRREFMLEQHKQEKEQAEKAYQEELQERIQLWEDRLKNFQKEVVDHAQRLKQHQMAVLHNLKEKMSSKTPHKPQWSKELLKQRRIQACLGRQGKYLEAQDVKQNADRIEQAELQSTLTAFQAEVVAKEQAVRVKQQIEMDILLQRAARTREEIRKSRALDLQRCHQRHKNIMRELAAIQKQEVFRFEQLMQKKAQNYRSGLRRSRHHIESPHSRSQINLHEPGTEDTVSSAYDVESLAD